MKTSKMAAIQTNITTKIHSRLKLMLSDKIQRTVTYDECREAVRMTSLRWRMKTAERYELELIVRKHIIKEANRSMNLTFISQYKKIQIAFNAAHDRQHWILVIIHYKDNYLYAHRWFIDRIISHYLYYTSIYVASIHYCYSLLTEQWIIAQCTMITNIDGLLYNKVNWSMCFVCLA